MFKFTDAQLSDLGAAITTREIGQQPTMWQEVMDNYVRDKYKIDHYLAEIAKKHDRIKVIFTGAGTSAFVGETVLPYLLEKVDEKKWELSSVATTDILSNPTAYFKKNVATLLVSFARSGNSPESIATVELGQKLITDFYQLTITCAKEGKLAQKAQYDQQNLLLLQPAQSNDKGFAMTSSYTCMLLMTLLVFDTIDIEHKKALVDIARGAAADLIVREDEISHMMGEDFNRVVYLGSGSLASLTREASLKILELTAGKIATLFDSSLGFRHGPKSFVNEETLIFVFTSNDAYTRRYDLDICNEVKGDQVAKNVYQITTNSVDECAGNRYLYPSLTQKLPDAYLALPYIVFAQMVSVMAAIKVSNTPDTPSASGTVNRVVKGVIIHEFDEKEN